ncbi:hypothetical protein PPACK8108_LOCUS15437 [Phakopsora pachyrhizi]|uniref:Uncharacterized protein n=1 Tax=Phakopsora pachyrhizi TaxID=170000 RepID=A0AAV0B9T6_PHAPC|nr:hypothetical protein PPACK8108_LOCUS15437 [Phakopsora pachyrhizi]
MKRQIASSPEDPVSEDSVCTHIAKYQVMGKVGHQGAKDSEAGVLVIPPPLLGHGISGDAEGKTNLNYALSPGIPLKKVLQPLQQSSVAPYPIPPTPLIKKEYHHPTSLGRFFESYVGVSSQGSSTELPVQFAFEDGLLLSA